MNETLIKEAIINRFDAMNSSCNSHHINHNEGVIRGLLWALTGTDPQGELHPNGNYTVEVLTLAGIPFHIENERVICDYVKVER
jgi:hypothetical protein